jgi:hypothetical protein
MVMALCLVAVLANFSAVERLWAVTRSIRLRDEEIRKKSQHVQEIKSAKSVSELIAVRNVFK